MAQAQSGDTVQVHYTGKLEDGTVFDSSEGRDPIKFTLGQGQIIPGFEEAITGMSPEEDKTVTIPVDKAYGERNPQMVFSIERERIPADASPAVGQAVTLGNEEGRRLNAMITEVTDTHVTLDGNHPLAGKALIFDLRLVNID